MSTMSDEETEEETEEVAETTLRLGYRSLFSVPQEEEPRPVDAAMTQLNSWLRHKRYDVDALESWTNRSLSLTA